MAFDKDAAVKALVDNAQSGSTGKCAQYVRKALVAGGISTSSAPLSAKNYGSYLELWGFGAVEVSSLSTFSPQKADVVVLQSYPAGKDDAGSYSASSPHGHIAMYSGSAWISDFVQRDIWGGPGYRRAKPDAAIYRYKIAGA